MMKQSLFHTGAITGRSLILPAVFGMPLLSHAGQGVEMRTVVPAPIVVVAPLPNSHASVSIMLRRA